MTTPTNEAGHGLPELPEPEELLHSPMHGHVYGYTAKQVQQYAIDYAAALALSRGVPETGSWLAADDVYRHARTIDVALNGEDGAASRPALCDVVSQIASLARQHGPLAAALAAPAAAGAQGEGGDSLTNGLPRDEWMVVDAWCHDGAYAQLKLERGCRPGEGNEILSLIGLRLPGDLRSIERGQTQHRIAVDWLAFADELEAFKPRGELGALHGSGMAFAYKDVANTIRAKLATTTPQSAAADGGVREMARELLAAECGVSPEMVNKYQDRNVIARVALRAIEKALTKQPALSSHRQAGDVLARGWFHALPDYDDYDFHDDASGAGKNCPGCIRAMIVTEGSAARPDLSKFRELAEEWRAGVGIDLETRLQCADELLALVEKGAGNG